MEVEADVPRNAFASSCFLFFLVIGIRHIISLPSHYEANWIFKLTEPPYKWPIFNTSIFIIFIFLELAKSWFSWFIYLHACYYAYRDIAI